MNLTKEQSIVNLLECLGLTERGWLIVDHWEGDMCAVGVAARSSPRRLVNVSTCNKKEGLYDYECESPSGQGEDEYEVADAGQDVAFDVLLLAMAKHLNKGAIEGHSTCSVDSKAK